MKTAIRLLLLGLVFGGVVVTAETRAESSSIFLSEINYAGSTDANNCKNIPVVVTRCFADKWVEITNPSENFVNLSGWKLLFNEGNGTNEQFVFSGSAGIEGKSTLVVGYTEKNFQSVLSISGNTADYTTFSMLRVSNNTSNMIHTELFDANGVSQDKVYFSTSSFVTTTGQSHSLEKLNGVWQLTTTEFSPNNFRTPRMFVFARDNSTPQIQAVTAILPAVNESILPSLPKNQEVTPNLQITREKEAVKDYISFPKLISPIIAPQTTHATANIKVGLPNTIIEPVSKAVLLPTISSAKVMEGENISIFTEPGVSQATTIVNDLPSPHYFLKPFGMNISSNTRVIISKSDSTRSYLLSDQTIAIFALIPLLQYVFEQTQIKFGRLISNGLERLITHSSHSATHC